MPGCPLVVIMAVWPELLNRRLGVPLRIDRVCFRLVSAGYEAKPHSLGSECYGGVARRKSVHLKFIANVASI